MDAAETPSLRRLLVRMAATLLALTGLYVLSVGPAAYVDEKLPASQTFLTTLYMPLFDVMEQTPLAEPFYSYVIWWRELAPHYGHPG